MSEMITVTAKTLDEAITKALIELGTTSDNLDYTIIEKGSAGIFGLFGGKNAVIKAKKKKEDDDLEEFLATGRIDSNPTPQKAPQSSSQNIQNSQKNQKSQSKASQKPIKDESVQESKPAAKPQQKPAPKPAAKQTPKPAVKQAPKPPVKPQPAVEESIEEKEEKKPVKKVDVEACETAAKGFLTQVFEAMGMKVQLETSFDEKEKELTVDMEGDDMGILIGKRGQTLDSLQYLVSLVVNKECDGYIRVKLDTENYRSRRKETLETLAKNIAYKVKRTRRSVSLEPMNPYERRIIHAALQNDRYVVTRSEGEDPFRHVVISLKREGRERGDRRRNQNQGQAREQKQESVQE